MIEPKTLSPLVLNGSIRVPNGIYNCQHACMLRQQEPLVMALSQHLTALNLPAQLDCLAAVSHNARRLAAWPVFSVPRPVKPLPWLRGLPPARSGLQQVVSNTSRCDYRRLQFHIKRVIFWRRQHSQRYRENHQEQHWHRHQHHHHISSHSIK